MLGPVEDLLARSHTDLSPAAADQLEVVNRNGLRLLRLVNNLLDFSRIEAGRIRAVYQPTDLAAFTADLASVFRAACERAGLRLVVDCPPLAEPAYVDREMWEKVVLNLLSNAFKFTFAGEIEVTLRQAGRAAELRVRDTGTGIPAGEMPRLFERFHRVENARGRTHEGSGIGLALVQELVKLHGGAVTAASAFGEGTTFLVTVPLGTAHLPADRIGEGRATAPAGAGAVPYVEEALRWLPSKPKEEGGRVRKEESESKSSLLPPSSFLFPPFQKDRPRVLVADDNADMRQYVARLLAAQYAVDAAPDGEAALAAARERPPDLVLADVMMPRLDGFGLLHALRADPRTDDIPVILLSARAGEESRVEGMEAGADDYLVKPFSARELLARVTAHLQMARLRRESAAALRRRDEFLSGILGSITDAFFSLDEGQRFAFVNDETVRRFGRPRDEIVGKHIWAMYPAAVGSAANVQLNRAMAERVAVEYEFYYEPWRRWFLDKAYPTAGGGLAVYSRDVTDRKRAEVELREAEERFRTLADHMSQFAWMADAKGWIFWYNRRWYEYTGTTLEEVQGWGWKKVHHPDHLERVVKRVQQSWDTGELWEDTFPLRGADGTYRWFLSRAVPIRDSAGRILR
jgi:PAS domain S-box-containing protein